MIDLAVARRIAARIPNPKLVCGWSRGLLDALDAVDELNAERDRLFRLVALAKSYRDCHRNEVEADTTDDEIGTAAQAEIDAETALFAALDAHDAQVTSG